MEKEFEQREDLGWIWHKSWNIPKITVRISVNWFNLEIMEKDTFLEIEPPENLSLRLYAVQVKKNKNNIYLLKDLGFSKEANIKIVDGCASISGLKFLTTSYKIDVSFF